MKEYRNCLLGGKEQSILYYSFYDAEKKRVIILDHSCPHCNIFCSRLWQEMHLPEEYFTFFGAYAYRVCE